jgi:hypothetical protein
MAAFTMNEALQHPLDFRLLQDAPISIYHSVTVLEADLTTLASLGYRIDRIDLATCGGPRFYEVFSQALGLPAFGHNRDAFQIPAVA